MNYSVTYPNSPYSPITRNFDAGSVEDAINQAVVSLGESASKGLGRGVSLGNAAGFRIVRVEVGDKRPDHQPMWDAKPMGPIKRGGYPVTVVHTGLRLAMDAEGTEYPERRTALTLHVEAAEAVTA
jgi:hypothetical protein